MNVHLYSWAKPIAEVIDRVLRQPDAIGKAYGPLLRDMSHDGMYLQHPVARKLCSALIAEGTFLHTTDSGNPEAGWFTVPNQAFAKGVAYCYDEESECVVFWWFNEDPNFK